jgi:hypothetical protein
MVRALGLFIHTGLVTVLCPLRGTVYVKLPVGRCPGTQPIHIAVKHAKGGAINTYHGSLYL